MATVFEAISSTLATLSQTSTHGGIAMRRDDELFYIGAAGEPVFCLERPDPDDAWGVYHEEAPAYFDGGWGDPQGEAWLEGSAARRSLGVLAELPRGDYELVRCGMAVGRPKALLLGNEWVPRPVWGANLLADDDLHVNVFGAAPDAAPALDQPLLGVPILNMANRLTGIFALEMASPMAEASKGVDGELVVVIPRTGPLVLNMLERFNADSHQAALDRWARQGARACSLRLAGG